MLKTNKSSMRIAVAGECNVGKTSIVRRFMQKQTYGDTVMTIGVDKYEKTLNFGGEEFNLTLLDMAGSQEFQSVIEGYLNRVDAVIFVYDVTDRESFATLPLWNNIVDNSTKGQRKVSKILVGNKKDIAKLWREVPSKTARNYANFEGMVYLEVSAKNDDNIELIFQCLTQEVNAKRATEIEKIKDLQRRPGIERRTRLNFLPLIRNLKSIFSKSWKVL